jgi:hypothetical protein
MNSSYLVAAYLNASGNLAMFAAIRFVGREQIGGSDALTTRRE